MNTCPRCHGPLIAEADGSTFCFCGYRDEGESDLSLYAEVMAAVPGGPLERYEEAMVKAKRTYQERKAGDLRLAEEAATRHGVSLEDLQKPMRGWRKMHPSVRFALQSVISDLTVGGLGIQRIATALNRHNRTITRSPGLARGRARRRDARRQAEHDEIEALMKGHKGRTLNTMAR